MSFNQLGLKRIDRTVGELCRRETRPELADQLRFECEIDGQYRFYPGMSSMPV
jgi:hypothetical protein